MAFDLVSRPEAFASLLPRLAEGYALDALGRPERSPDAEAAAAMVAQALAAPRLPLPTPGMGEGIAIGASALFGSGLVHDGELVALSAFPAVPSSGRPR
jgi:hypothetical protein